MTAGHLGSGRHLHEPLVRDLNGLNGDIVLNGVHGGAGPFCRQTALKIPDRYRQMEIVLKHDYAIASSPPAFDKAVIPIPKIGICRHAVLEHDVGPTHSPRELQDRTVTTAFVVFLDLLRRLQAAALAKSSYCDILDSRQSSRQHTAAIY